MKAVRGHVEPKGADCFQVLKLEDAISLIPGT